VMPIIAKRDAEGWGQQDLISGGCGPGRDHKYHQPESFFQLQVKRRRASCNWQRRPRGRVSGERRTRFVKISRADSRRPSRIVVPEGSGGSISARDDPPRTRRKRKFEGVDVQEETPKRRTRATM